MLNRAIQMQKKAAWNKLCRDLNEDVWGKGYKIITERLKLGSIILGEKEIQKQVDTLFPI